MSLPLRWDRLPFPPFLHLHPKAPEDLILPLFQSDLLFAYCEIAPDITNLVMN